MRMGFEAMRPDEVTRSECKQRDLGLSLVSLSPSGREKNTASPPASQGSCQNRLQAFKALIAASDT